MDEPEYYDEETMNEIYSEKEKESKKGLIQRFFDFWRFPKDEDYHF